MRSTFMGLEASKRGLFTQQSALYTTGHNVSNANTEGYSRQRVNMQPTLGYPGVGLNTPKTAGFIGTGVEAHSVQRIRDEFIDRQYRQETNKLGYWESRANSISQMEDIMSEPSEFGLNEAFNLFWSSLQDISGSSDDAAARKVAIQRAEHLADSFNYIDTQLKQIQGNLGNEIDVSTSQINSILKQIAEINKQIQAVEPNGYMPNDLYDARDTLVDKLNEYLPVSIERVPSGGNALKIAEGSLTIKLKKADGTEIELVNGKNYAKINTISNSNLPSSSYQEPMYKLDGNNNKIPIMIPDPNDPTKQIKATDVNGNVVYEPVYELNSNGEKILNDPSVTPDPPDRVLDDAGNYLYKIKTTTIYVYDTTSPLQKITGEDLTQTFSNLTVSLLGDPPNENLVQEGSIINHSDMDQSKGKLLSLIDSYGYKEIITNPDNTQSTVEKGYYVETLQKLDKLANVFIDAFNEVHKQGFNLYSTSTSIAGDDTVVDANGKPGSGIAFFEKTAEGDIKVRDEILNDPNLLAASAGGGEEGNGKWAMELANLQYLSLNSDTLEIGSKIIPLLNGEHLDGANFQSYYRSIIGQLGVDGQESERLRYNSETIRLTVANNRSSMSSVSLDEEMTNMITFQQAYNANARMITVIDETLDKIINGMGRAGL